jgi:hypothetical protein
MPKSPTRPPGFELRRIQEKSLAEHTLGQAFFVFLAQEFNLNKFVGE